LVDGGVFVPPRQLAGCCRELAGIRRQIRKVCNRKRERLDELLKNQFLVWSNGLATENADVVA